MYIDPNTGGMLFQVLAVAFGLVSGFVLLFSGRIRMFWARFRRSIREHSSESETARTEEVETAIESESTTNV